MMNRVHSYDKNTKVAMVAGTPQPVMSRGSNKDSLRTIGLPWQLYTLGYMDIPWLLGYTGIVPCGGAFDPRIMVQILLSHGLPGKLGHLVYM